MVDAALFPAIRAAVRANELGGVSPYCLSYARLSNSGASFGVFQGDTNVNSQARIALTHALSAAGIDTSTIDRLVAAVSMPLPDGSPLSADDSALVNGALAAPAGRTIVDQMDDELMVHVVDGIDSCIAASNPRPIDPEAQLYIALWTNMTGPPTTLTKWLGGTPEIGLASPGGDTVAAADLASYLQASSFYQKNPRNFAHLQASVRAGVTLLPSVATS